MYMQSCGIVMVNVSQSFVFCLHVQLAVGTAAPSPDRAITSTLSTRAAPTITSQTYEPLARAVLRRRLFYEILSLSILPVSTSTICWKMWNSGGMSASGILNTLVMPIHPGMLLMSDDDHHSVGIRRIVLPLNLSSKITAHK
jgi:hypothetical protein